MKSYCWRLDLHLEKYVNKYNEFFHWKYLVSYVILIELRRNNSLLSQDIVQKINPLHCVVNRWSAQPKTFSCGDGQ